jgi:hypothetical protein
MSLSSIVAARRFGRPSKSLRNANNIVKGDQARFAAIRLRNAARVRRHSDGASAARRRSTSRSCSRAGTLVRPRSVSRPCRGSTTRRLGRRRSLRAGSAARVAANARSIRGGRGGQGAPAIRSSAYRRHPRQWRAALCVDLPISPACTATTACSVRRLRAPSRGGLHTRQRLMPRSTVEPPATRFFR